MSQPETDRPVALAPGGYSPPMTSERKPDHLAIFSAPAVEVVFQWWLESNRRWTERNRDGGR